MNDSVCKICGKVREFSNGRWVCPACTAKAQKEFMAKEVDLTEEEYLLWEAAEALTQEKFDTADDDAEGVLSKNPRCARAFVIKLLAEKKLKSQAQIANLTEEIDDNPNFKNALELAEPELKLNLQRYRDTIQNNAAVYKQAAEAVNRKNYDEACRLFNKIPKFRDASQRAEECRQQKELQEKDAQNNKENKEFSPKSTRQTQKAYEKVLQASEIIYKEGKVQQEFDCTLSDWNEFVDHVLQYSVLQVIVSDGVLNQEEAEYIAGLTRYGDLRDFFKDEGYEVSSWSSLYGKDVEQLKELCRKYDTKIKNYCGIILDYYSAIADYDTADDCYIQFKQGTETIIKDAITQSGVYDANKMTICSQLYNLLQNMKSELRRKKQSGAAENDSGTHKSIRSRKKAAVKTIVTLGIIAAIIVGIIIAVNIHNSKVTISFDANGGVGEVQPQTARIGKEYVLPDYFGSKENYKFVGWSKSKNGAADYADGGTIASVPGDITLYAVWEEANHVPVTDAAVAPTCTTAGKTEGSHCSLCGEIITAQQTIPATGHTAGKWITDAEATCTAAGSKHQVCSVCGATLNKETISAKGHKVVTDKAVEPTCTATGKTTGSHCSVCNAVITAQQDVPATGHTVVTDNAVSATCSTEGKTAGSHCSVCNAVIVAQTILSKTAHNYATTVVAPTYTEKGYTEHRCADCGYVYKDTWVDMLPQEGCSVGLEFTLNADGWSCSVTGIGTCADTQVIIPSFYNGYTVTEIGSKAFKSSKNMTSVTIPGSIITIGENAFKSCNNLTSVTLSGGTTTIGAHAFDSCTHLTSVTIPYGVTSIGDYAFYYCTRLESVTIPNSVTSIGGSAFGICALKSITIPDSVKTLGEQAFYACDGLTDIVIPGSVTSISRYLFWNCSNLASITISNGVTSIDSYAFENCKSLTSVTIPNSVTSIGECAFEDCKVLKNVTIAKSVTSIGQYAFRRCTVLDSVSFVGTKAEWQSVTKGSDWFKRTALTVIHCTDGEVVAK